MTTEQPHVNDRETTPAAHTACSECPWRASNVGKQHPEEEWYTTRQWTRNWRGIAKDGDVAPCHLFLPMGWKDEWAELGYQKASDTGVNRECAGAAALVHREVREAHNYPSWEAYHQARPTGLSREAFLIHRARTTGAQEPAFRVPEAVAEGELIKPEQVVDTQSPEWKFSPAAADAIIRAGQALFPQLRGDDQGMFTRHADVHDMAELVTAEGLIVTVDVRLRPLLVTLAENGVRTIASCQDFREIVEKQRPHRLSVMMHRAIRGTLNHETTLRRRAAFIRLRNAGPAEQQFIAAAAQLEDVTVETVSLLTQLVFPLERAGGLAALAQQLTDHSKSL